MARALGNHGEDAPLDTVAATERNTRTVRYVCEAFCIDGRIDGMRGDTVVEAKTRTRWWSSPPAYDLTQLRCYVAMAGAPDGILLERLGTRETHTRTRETHTRTRETRVEHDPAWWASCVARLSALAERIHKISGDEAATLCSDDLSDELFADWV